MKIWDNDKKEFEEDLPTNLETGLSIADKLLSIAKKPPSGNGYKNNILKTSVLLQSLQEETKQKDRILYAIIELRKVDKLSEEEFKIMMLAYTSTSKFWGFQI